MKIYKSMKSMAQLAVALLLAGCSTDGYWDEAPAAGEELYTFDQTSSTYSISGTEVLNQIDVPLTRNTNKGAATLTITAEFNNSALSGPSEVTFADGSNTAVYTISVGGLQVGVSYKATLTFDESLVSVAGINSTAISLTKNYSWVSAGSAQFYSAWSGSIDEDGNLLGDGVKVSIEKAEGGEGLYRLVSPYYYSEKASGITSGLSLGGHIQFQVDPSNGDALTVPQRFQAIGEKIGDYGNWYFGFLPDNYGSYIANSGNFYFSLGLMCYDKGTSSRYLYDYETMAFIWNEGYPW